MTSAADVLKSHGLGLADEIVRAAEMEGLPLAVAATMIASESGGRNVFGHDPVDTDGAYIKGGPVTRDNYLAYRAAMLAGRIGRQGVGPAQCTSAEFQDRADQLGGCWDPVANMRSGFRGLANRIKTYGLRSGFRAYNGSGPAAEAYAGARMREVAVWRARLAGTTTEEEDMQPDERDALYDIREQMTGSRSSRPPQYPGWPARPDTSTDPKTLVDYVRAMHSRQNALDAKLDAILAKLAK